MENFINLRQNILRYTVANAMSLGSVTCHWLTSGFMQLAAVGKAQHTTFQCLFKENVPYALEWGQPYSKFSFEEVYYINITFSARVTVENIIPRNVIINRGAAEVDNHISRDDIFDYHPSRKCNIYFIIPNRTLDPLFSEVEPLLLLNKHFVVRGDLKGK